MREPPRNPATAGGPGEEHVGVQSIKPAGGWQEYEIKCMICVRAVGLPTCGLGVEPRRIRKEAEEQSEGEMEEAGAASCMATHGAQQVGFRRKIEEPVSLAILWCREICLWKVGEGEGNEAADREGSGGSRG